MQRPTHRRNTCHGHRRRRNQRRWRSRWKSRCHRDCWRRRPSDLPWSRASSPSSASGSASTCSCHLHRHHDHHRPRPSLLQAGGTRSWNPRRALLRSNSTYGEDGATRSRSQRRRLRLCRLGGCRWSPSRTPGVRRRTSTSLRTSGGACSKSNAGPAQGKYVRMGRFSIHRGYFSVSGLIYS
jgi:hypothetical protein